MFCFVCLSIRVCMVYTWSVIWYFGKRPISHFLRTLFSLSKCLSLSRVGLLHPSLDGGPTVRPVHPSQACVNTLGLPSISVYKPCVYLEVPGFTQRPPGQPWTIQAMVLDPSGPGLNHTTRSPGQYKAWWLTPQAGIYRGSVWGRNL